MTYEESYAQIKAPEELKAKAIRDTKVALLLGGNPDRLKAIEDTMDHRMKEIEK